MKLKLENLDMAYSEATAEEAARRIAEDFGLLVELTGRTGGGGWPTITVIGTPAQLLKLITSEGGYSTGDADEDAEMVYYWMKDAKEIFG